MKFLIFVANILFFANKFQIKCDELGWLDTDEGPLHDPVTGDYALEAKFPAEEPPNPDSYSCEKAGYVHPDLDLDAKDVIKKYGYDFEAHTVHTEDKYILTIYRIKATPNSPAREGKKVVFLQHGLMGNAMSWLFLYGNNTLAYKLANAGYDVFLGNVRGSVVSQKHEKLTTDSDAYWDFSFHEVGIYDMPAITDYILNVTGQPDMYFVGQSLGTAMFLIWQSEKPEYASKIRVAFLLCPAGYLAHLSNNGLVLLFGYYPADHAAWKVGFGNSVTRTDLVKFMDRTCALLSFVCGLCDNAGFFFQGFNPKQNNFTIANYFGKKYFDTTATKMFAHAGQHAQYKTFKPYDYKNKDENMKRYGMDPPGNYKLDRIQTPIVSFWGYGDTVTTPIDVKKTIRSLNPLVVKENNRVRIPSFDHVDFLIGKDVNKHVYNRILFIMNKGLYVKEKTK